MSSRNTGLFVAGHLSDEQEQELVSKGLRVGRAVRRRKRYSHVGIPELEEGGSVLFDHLELPGDNNSIFRQAKELSKPQKKAVLLFCDDEQGVGGHLLFENGELVSRDIIDGRSYTPVQRSIDEETPLEGLDDSDWVWPLITSSLEQGAKSIVGLGIKDDDSIESLIEAAGSMAEEAYTPPSRQNAPEAQVRGRSDRVGRLIGRLKRRLKR